jgi:hypothetical protein
MSKRFAVEADNTLQILLFNAGEEEAFDLADEFHRQHGT